MLVEFRFSLLQRRLSPILLLLLAIVAPATGWAQLKPTVTPEQYGRWESFAGAPALSEDGHWMAAPIRRVNGAKETRVRAIAGSDEQVLAWAEHPVFSADSHWMAWTIALSEKEQKQLKEEKKPVQLAAGLLDLRTRKERRFEAISRFAFDDSGGFLALLGYAPDEPKGQGANLRVLELNSGTETTFGNVAEFAWSETASLLAMTVATGKDEGNGVQLFSPVSGRLRNLDTSASSYHGLSWRKDAADLAFVRSGQAASKEKPAGTVIAARDLEASRATPLVLDPVAAGLAEKLEVVIHHQPHWSDDGAMISIGLRPREPQEEEKESASAGVQSPDEKPKKDAKEEEELPALQIWHTFDVRIFPSQKVWAERDKRRTLLAVWVLQENRIVQVGTDLEDRAEMAEGWKHGIERAASAYPWGTMFGRPYHDLWVTEISSGERTRALSKVRYSWLSASGHYLLYFDGEQYWTHHLASGKQTNITASLDAQFADLEYDTPTDQLPPHGVGGWLKDDSAVFLYDTFDIWRVAPDGSGGRRITNGAPEQIYHRLVDLDPDQEWFDSDNPLYLSIRGRWSEKQGYARLTPGADEPEVLLFEEKRVLDLRKAEKAEVYIYRVEGRDDSPDYFTAAADLQSPRVVTETNPFQADFAWTRSALFEFQSESGRRLQAGLLYPANHDASRRYPMIVYTYELLSSRIHDYEPPSERDYYNFTAWTQQGYFVLLPDIVYEAREPGISALQAVRPAVARVVEMGLVDAGRVGLIGHSWGGYQATYLPTRTNIFAASVAGAPLTDFVSFMGQIHWRSGNAELDHWETGQARMEVPYWEDPEAHHRNSPIHKVQEMETPLLMAFGSDDGVVDWDQGTEFYNFARRAGKQMVLLVYEGEGHGFREEANQIDYHRRILEWFGHYLKDEPAPDWITRGVQWDQLEAEKKRVARSDTRP